MSTCQSRGKKWQAPAIKLDWRSSVLTLPPYQHGGAAIILGFRTTKKQATHDDSCNDHTDRAQGIQQNIERSQLGAEPRALMDKHHGVAKFFAETEPGSANAVADAGECGQEKRQENKRSNFAVELTDIFNVHHGLSREDFRGERNIGGLIET
jgi:hypothetical protein